MLNILWHIEYTMKKDKVSFHMLHRALAGRNGLSSKVKMTVYKQIVRPAMAYAFPIWYGIWSHQMELIRIIESKILAYCLGLRKIRTEEDHYIAPYLRSIYEGAETKRIDRFMTETAPQCLSEFRAHSRHRGSDIRHVPFARIFAVIKK